MVLGLSLKVEVPYKSNKQLIILIILQSLKNASRINLETFGLPHECPKHQYIANSLELLAQ